MVDQRTIHRLAATGALLSAVAFTAWVAVQPNRPTMPRAMWVQVQNSETSEWFVWAVLVGLSIGYAMAVRRDYRLKDALLIALISLSTLYVAGHIAFLALTDETHEYWKYLTDFGVFRWLLAPWYAGYATTCFLASIGVWAATSGRLRKP